MHSRSSSFACQRQWLSLASCHLRSFDICFMAGMTPHGSSYGLCMGLLTCTDDSLVCTNSSTRTGSGEGLQDSRISLSPAIFLDHAGCSLELAAADQISPSRGCCMGYMSFVNESSQARHHRKQQQFAYGAYMLAEPAAFCMQS